MKASKALVECEVPVQANCKSSGDELFDDIVVPPRIVNTEIKPKGQSKIPLKQVSQTNASPFDMNVGI